ncbi:MAG TPA: type 1 glutamine amidotransferase domain-containing protein, partial [Rhodospirillaceae bacterium]|nr:type 1 glutamine amidotransferase domain-containing protein [Rhodospirillaceae bacterium]
MKKVLTPVTNHATLGETDQANGTYAPELTHVVDQLIEAGIDYDIASIKGGQAPLYGIDVENDPVNDRVLANARFQEQVNNTMPVTDINIDQYDAIFYPGGFGL